MTEGIGPAVAAEVPIVVVDVMRGRPSTGIPAKSEQSDLSFAVDGLHGDAPRPGAGPNGIADCRHQRVGRAAGRGAAVARAAAVRPVHGPVARGDRPAHAGAGAGAAPGGRGHTEGYQRYADTPSGVSPMAIPARPASPTPPTAWSTERGIPAAGRDHVEAKLDKRLRKLMQHDYGSRWPTSKAMPTLPSSPSGSTTAAREAVERAAAAGTPPAAFGVDPPLAPLARAGGAGARRVRQVLVVEQNHGGQLLRYLRSCW